MEHTHNPTKEAQALPLIDVKNPVVSVEWLEERIGDPSLIVLCASMGKAEKSLAEGIPGAILADIEGPFSQTDAPFPHTVPENLRSVFSAAGVPDDDSATTIVVYDRFGVVCAPRIWWLAKVAGLQNVAVLDGGLPAWKAAGHGTAPVHPMPYVLKTALPQQPQADLLTDLRGVERGLARSATEVVDARSAGRFEGVEPEPRPGLHSGHIPGSRNLPYTDFFIDGKLKPADELRAMFEHEVGEGNPHLIMSCGSGVTACVNALAATVAGYDDIAVYDGSWSEWGSQQLDQPIG